MIVALAFAAGLAGALSAMVALGGSAHGTRALAETGRLADVVVRVGREGRDPGGPERRRLLAVGALSAFAAGWLVGGPPVALAVGAGGPWAVGRALRARRDHYRRAVDREAAALALTLADALGAGHSLRGALTEARAGVVGAASYELGRVASELEAGARTDEALDAMRTRVHSGRWDAIVAACLVQRRAGGDLARLLRELADSFGEQERLQEEVRSTTAQARFTGLVVVLMPLGGALLAELASPGFIVGLWDSLLTAWLVGLALALQGGAMYAIHRLGRVKL